MANPAYDQILKIDVYTNLPTSAGIGQLAIDMSTMVTYQFNGTAWNPLGRPNVKLSTVSVNALAMGTYDIYTLENLPVNFVPTQVVTTIVSQTGSIVTAPTITVGTNATTYDNIAKGSLVGGILALLGAGNGATQMASSSPKLSAGTHIYAKVTNVASGPTVLLLNIDILGYLKA